MKRLLEICMIKLSDYVFKWLGNYGVRHVFMIPGGGAMHLNDSVGRHPDIDFICNHHEQAGAIGAEGYSRACGRMGVVVCTSGPGGTNTLTGLTGQWLDSIPVLYISGQIKRETCIKSYPGVPLRQLGDQELNIVDVVKPITKFAEMLTDAKDIRRLLEEAVYKATHGRPGPAWLDIPLDLQSAMVDESTLEPWTATQDAPEINPSLVDWQIGETIQLLLKSKRPVVVAGSGIRLSGGIGVFQQLLSKLRIPVLGTFNGIDLIPTADPLCVGPIGTLGSRGGNFALQNADLVICLGTRNNIRQVSYAWQSFASRAKKVVVDIDQAELRKPTVAPDVAVHADVKVFMAGIVEKLSGVVLPDYESWRQWCQERKKKYPVVLPEYREMKDAIQPYLFAEVLTERLPPGSTVVTGNGSACITIFQAGVVKQGSRFFWNSGCATMGYDLPASIGACFATDKRPVVCYAGDGSLMMNLQELATVAYHKLPVKIFVLNNNGYISMRQTQSSFFENRLVAADPGSGVGFPDFCKVGESFGIPSFVLENPEKMNEVIDKVMALAGPALVNVKCPYDYRFIPKLSSDRKADGTLVSKPLEDLFPFLDREEFQSNMISG